MATKMTKIKLDLDDVLLRAMYFADKADPGICFFNYHAIGPLLKREAQICPSRDEILEAVRRQLTAGVLTVLSAWDDGKDQFVIVFTDAGKEKMRNKKPLRL